MHDCPTCGVPLHGHEEVCPSCGARQYVRRHFYGGSGVPQAPGVNWMPFVVVFVVVAIGLFIFAQQTWVGQLMREGPRQEDPLEKMTYTEARQIIESEITKGLAAVGATGTFAWTAAGSPADKMADQPLELTINTKLSDPQQRRQIIDPIKQYMEKAKIPTLTMNDEKSHATWTYSVQLPAGGARPEGAEEAPAPSPPPPQESAPPAGEY